MRANLTTTQTVLVETQQNLSKVRSNVPLPSVFYFRNLVLFLFPLFSHLLFSSSFRILILHFLLLRSLSSAIPIAAR